MAWNSPPEEQTADRAGFSEHALDLLSSVLGYLRARFELAGIESKEAVATYGKAAVLVVGALCLAVFGYLFLWIGVVAVVAWLAGVFWGWIALAAGILHFIGAFGLIAAAKAKWGRPVFPVTLQEFRKDQEWLNRPKPTESHS